MKLSKNCTKLVVSLLLALSFVSIPLCDASSAEFTQQEEVMTFLKDVAGLDMTKYDAELISCLNVPADLADEAMTTVMYSLKSEGSTLAVSFGFKNNLLISCFINSIKGSPIIVTQAPRNDVEAVQNIITGYQSYSGVSYLQPLQNAFNSFDALESTTTIIDDTKLLIDSNSEENSTYVEWMNTVNGIDNLHNRVIIRLVNNNLEMFTNTWDLYQVGSSDVKVSEEEAITIAKQVAENYSYTVGNTTVNNFTILDEPFNTELRMQSKGNYTLYPQWAIRLCLDEVYLGGVTEIRVLMWADTAEVTYIAALGSLGSPFVEDDVSIPQENNTLQTLDTWLVAISVVTVICIAVAIITIKKKYK